MADQSAEKKLQDKSLRRTERGPAKVQEDAAAAAVRAIVDDATQEPKAYVDRFVVPSEGE